MNSFIPSDCDSGDQPTPRSISFGLLVIFLLVTLVAFLCGCQGSLNATTFTSEPTVPLGETILSTIATYAAPFLAYVILRLLTVHLVVNYMMRRSPEVPTVKAVADGEGVTGPANKAKLGFVELNAAKGILLNDVYQDRLERAEGTGRQTWKLFWGSLLAFGLVIISILIVDIFARSNGQETAGTELGGLGLLAFLSPAGLVATASLVVLIFLLLPFVGGQYSSTGRVSFAPFVLTVLLLTGISVGAGLAFGGLVYPYVLPPIFAALVGFWGYRDIRRLARQEGNLKLLILRVFNADRNTFLVFGRLMEAWQYVGSYMTIVDPSYIRYQFSLSSRQNRRTLLRILVIYSFVITGLTLGGNFLMGMLPVPDSLYAAWNTLDQTERSELIGTVIWLALILLAIVPILVIVSKRFVRSLTALQRRINAAQTSRVGLDGNFKGYSMYCFDNVWKEAVQEMLAVSNGVLMDLRGFSPERRGCEYEIGLLIDHVPIHRVLFLVDSGQAKQGVYEIIRERWADMRPESPNQDVLEPVVKVYAPGGEETRDLPRILALLASSVGREREPAGSLVGFEGPLPEEGAQTKRAVYLKDWRHRLAQLPESIDMAMATPRFGRVVIPLLLVALVVLFYVRLRPAVDAFSQFGNSTDASAFLVEPSTFAGSVQESEASSQIEAAQPALSQSVGAVTRVAPTGAMQELQIDAVASIAEGRGGIIDGVEFSDPVEVVIRFEGGVAAEATGYGQVEITSATSNTGESLKILNIGQSYGSDLTTEFETINRDETDFFTGEPVHPLDGFSMPIEFFDPEGELTAIQTLEGTLILAIPAETYAFDLSSLPEGREISLENPELQSVGSFTLVIDEANPNNVGLIFEGQDDSQSDAGTFYARIVDADGNEFLPFEFRINNIVQLSFLDEGYSLDGAMLEIILVTHSAEVPFSLSNIIVQ